MFLKRLASAIVMIAVLITAIILGGIPFWLLILLIGEVSVWELLRAVGITEKEKKKRGIVYFEMLLMAVMMFGMYMSRFTYSLLVALTILIVVLLTIYVFKFGKYTISEISTLLFAFLYTGILPSFVGNIRTLHDGGRYLVWLVLIPPIASDTFAYCVGMLFGKHKLAPVVSPKKSIEGSVGGVIGAALCTALYGYYASGRVSAAPGFVPACLVIGLVCGGLSQIGDLAASAIKREYSVKDYGNIIPGHGGALDRADSIIYIAPLVYFGVEILEKFFMK